MRSSILFCLLLLIIFASCTKRSDTNVTPTPSSPSAPVASDTVDFLDSSVFRCYIDGIRYVPQTPKSQNAFGPGYTPLAIYMSDTFLYVGATYYVKSTETVLQRCNFHIRHPLLGYNKLYAYSDRAVEFSGYHLNGYSDSTRDSYLYLEEYDPARHRCKAHFECLIYDPFEKKEVRVTGGVIDIPGDR